MRIPLARPSVGAAEVAAVTGVIESGWLGLGPVAARFEARVASFVGAGHAVAVSSGTAALHLALEAAGVGGGEVIVPSLTYAATVQAILAARATPVFAECHEQDLCLDVADAARRVSPRTRAIVPVHYGGRPVDMSALLAVARERGLTVVEDAAHAFGSTFDGRRIGGFGDLTCFSFDPIKTVTCGEGGAICTGTDMLAERLRRLRRLGMARPRRRRREPVAAPDEVIEPGYRCHLSDVFAAVGLAQLDRVDRLFEARRQVARRYDRALRGVPGLTLLRHDLGAEVPFCYTVRVARERREGFRRWLARHGVETGVLYPPNHLQPAFRRFTTALPVTEAVGAECVSLPLFAGMTDVEVDHVIDRVCSYGQRHDLPV